MAYSQEWSHATDETTMFEGIARAQRHTTLAERSSAVLEETSTELLKRALSTKSVISTTSSFAARMQVSAEVLDSTPAQLRVIGLGSCRTVFEIAGTEITYKKGTQLKDMWQNFIHTNRVQNSIDQVQDTLQQGFPDAIIPKTPACHDFKR